MRWACAAIALLVGCTGERVESLTEDSGTDASGSDASTDTRADAACDDMGENLLANGSFEQWTGAKPDGWEGPITRSPETPYHCATSARLTLPGYATIEQAVHVPPTTAGAVLSVTGAIRWVSGAKEAPDFAVGLEPVSIDAGGDLPSIPTTGYASDGKWHSVSGALALPAGVTTITLDFANTSPSPQVLDVDRLVLRLSPP